MQRYPSGMRNAVPSLWTISWKTILFRWDKLFSDIKLRLVIRKSKIFLRPLIVLFIFSGVANLELSLIASQPKTNIGVREFRDAIKANITRVSHFSDIRKKAEEMGIRVWLFGGTASAFGHYVRWDLERQHGDQSYQDEKFDYRYANIFRSTQDCDLVIDGNLEQASELERWLKEKYPHVQGSKDKWEIRLLSKARGDKEALLNNKNFLNQHSDSNSVGLIEITSSDQIINDLYHWEKNDPPFFEDLRQGSIHFYHSDKHARTPRYLKGLNPPIFSVIRFLTKVFQFDLQISRTDQEAIQKLINDFDPKIDLRTDYARGWMEKNAKKLFLHAINLERAASVLDQLGLRKKLTKLGDPSQIGSMSWLLSKKPLASKPIPKETKGRTAKDLGLDIVAHETSDFFAYESITKSYQGNPNVFESRNNYPGESAEYGDGFYTRIGREGARGTLFTIRFRMNPDAEEGKDFSLINDYVLIKNKSAFKVIPELLSLTPIDFIDLFMAQKFDPSDHGAIQRFKEYIRTSSKSVDNADNRPVIQKLRERYLSTIAQSQYDPIRGKVRDLFLEAVFQLYGKELWPLLENAFSMHEYLSTVLPYHSTSFESIDPGRDLPPFSGRPEFVRLQLLRLENISQEEIDAIAKYPTDRLNLNSLLETIFFLHEPGRPIDAPAVTRLLPILIVLRYFKDQLSEKDISRIKSVLSSIESRRFHLIQGFWSYPEATSMILEIYWRLGHAKAKPEGIIEIILLGCDDVAPILSFGFEAKNWDKETKSKIASILVDGFSPRKSRTAFMKNFMEFHKLFLSVADLDEKENYILRIYKKYEKYYNEYRQDIYLLTLRDIFGSGPDTDRELEDHFKNLSKDTDFLDSINIFQEWIRLISEPTPSNLALMDQYMQLSDWETSFEFYRHFSKVFVSNGNPILDRDLALRLKKLMKNPFDHRVIFVVKNILLQEDIFSIPSQDFREWFQVHPHHFLILSMNGMDRIEMGRLSRPQYLSALKFYFATAPGNFNSLMAVIEKAPIDNGTKIEFQNYLRKISSLKSSKWGLLSRLFNEFELSRILKQMLKKLDHRHPSRCARIIMRLPEYSQLDKTESTKSE